MGSKTGKSIIMIPIKRTNIPFTTPRTVPPIIYAKAISKPDNGAISKSGSCCKSFICNIELAVFEVALVKVFIIIRPGKINQVYDTPCISEILCSKVNPKIKI